MRETKMKVFNEVEGLKNANVYFNNKDVTFLVEEDKFKFKRKSLFDYAPFTGVFCIRGKGVKGNAQVPIIASANDMNRMLKRLNKTEPEAPAKKKKK